MDETKKIRSEEDVIRIMNAALEHEWAVSLEYLFHAYSMPKDRFFYEDPVMKIETDVRRQTIQIGIDEMYHSLQLGVIITQMGGTPSFKTDEVRRYPRIIDNLKRDKTTEDVVTDLYQSAEFEGGIFPKIKNMFWNISSDEVRHSRQFTAMIEALKKEKAEEALCYRPNPHAAEEEEVQLLHGITRLENELMHRYLKHVLLFSEHQDLMQRLFKNSINHMRHWDKNSGILIKWGDVIRIENAETDSDGVERSSSPMPSFHPGQDRLSALEALLPSEESLIETYERLIPMISDKEVKAQLELHVSLNREHVFTQEWLIKNAKKIKNLA